MNFSTQTTKFLAAAATLTIAGTVSAQLPHHEDLILGPIPMTGLSKGVAFNYQPFLDSSGTLNWGGVFIEPGGRSGGHNQEVHLDNAGLHYDFDSSGGWVPGPQRNLLLYIGEYGGELRIRFSNSLGMYNQVHPDVIDFNGTGAAGVMIDVVSGGTDGNPALVRLVGDVNDLEITGLHVWVDMGVRPCTDGLWDDLPLGSTYNVGDLVTTLGLDVQLSPYFGSGAPGYAEIQDGRHSLPDFFDNQALGADYEIHLNNITANIDLTSTGALHYQDAKLRFGEYGGGVEFLINGNFIAVPDIRNLDGLTLGGCYLDVYAGGNGNDAGEIHIIGPVKSIGIGGEELWIDCLDGTPVYAMLMGDADGDGFVGFSDFTALLLEYGSACKGGCSADFDEDGDVDTDDFSTLLINWGASL